ncbi:hypothetical protein [Janthinobacterium sp. Ant5-2-1]|uniref:hypothetical protein n=1 Tax=Janthinobacterium sp. Ant5-2-1 TaxID=1755239 RepID=UPI001F1C8C37|nr:hypothetical protein [Janthinobacterium sp. Ant5-2-1]
MIVSIIEAPELHLHANLGVNKPNTDGDKPYFMWLVQAAATEAAQIGEIAFAIGALVKWRFSQTQP